MEELIRLEMEKREEIVNTFDKNYLLEAGAGAGKTTIIVERIINHIIDEKIDPKNIVAITFTKAASLELAERIERRALDYISKEGDQVSRKNLERVEELFSGTIHSFCEMLLREMPFEAGLTPGYEIVEDGDKFHEEIWHEFLRNEREAYIDYIDRLRYFNIDYRDLKTGALAVMDNLDIEFVGFDIKENYEELEKRFKSLDTSSLNPNFIKTKPNLGRLLRRIIEENNDLSEYKDELLKECPKMDLEGDLAGQYLYKASLEKDGAEELVAFIKLIADIYSSLNGLIYNTCTDFVNLLGKYKQENYSNYLTFNDLLYKACKLIKTSRKAREHFRDKFKYFYIDEAQDTDPLQAELLLLLSHKGDIEGLKSFTDVEPKAGSLFIVADPKQSIYRFRRADISIYESVKGVIDKFGEVVKLDINFRSTNAICSWVEDTFKDREDGFAFTKESSPTQASFERILDLWKPEERGDENQLSGVYKYEVLEKAKEVDFKEADYIGKLVREIIDTKYIEEKIGRDEFVNRRVENKDIMILTKTNVETGIFLEALKRNDIPGLLGGEKKLSDNGEVLKLFLLVDFLVDPRDDIKFVATLRNCFNLEAETISLLFENGQRRNVMFADKEFKELDHPHLKEAIFYLKAIFTKSKLEDPIIFIERLIRDKIGIYDSYREYTEIEKRDADSSLMQTLELLKARQAISLYQLKEELKELIDKEISYELPINLNFAENAVRVMNIHKSKGLEANIVILVGWDKGRDFIPDRYHVEKKEDKSLGYIYYNSDTLIVCPDQNKRKKGEKEFREAEIDRLIYVAATRAKSVLILPSIEDKKMLLYPLNENIDKKLVLKEPDIQARKEVLTDRKIEESNITKEIDIKREIGKASYKKLSPSKTTRLLSFAMDEDLSRKKFTPRGKVYGTIVHRMFEIILRDIEDIKSIEESNIDYAISIAIKEALDSMELDEDTLKGLLANDSFDFQVDEIESIRKKTVEFLSENLKNIVDSFVKNEKIIDIFSNPKSVFTEFPFSVSVDPSLLDLKEKETLPHLVSGEIDLLIQNKDGNFIIIDYKTDIVDSLDQLKERYRSQLEIYKKSLEVALKGRDISVEDLYIYSTYLEEILALEERVMA